MSGRCGQLDTAAELQTDNFFCILTPKRTTTSSQVLALEKEQKAPVPESEAQIISKNTMNTLRGVAQSG